MSSKIVMSCQRRKKQNVVELSGGKCSLCGYDKCINALEFHHLENKKESPSYIIMRWSWERAREELEKCILVCANCHREIHYLNKDVSKLRGEKKFFDKTCPVCESLFVTAYDKQVHCTDECAKYSIRKVERPSKQDLENYLANKVPFVRIARIYGVSDNAVKKWCKSYGLPSRKKDL